MSLAWFIFALFCWCIMGGHQLWGSVKFTKAKHSSLKSLFPNCQYIWGFSMPLAWLPSCQGGMNPKGGKPHHDLHLTLCEEQYIVRLNSWSPASLLLNPFNCNTCKDICIQLHRLLSVPPQSCSKDWRCLRIILKELVWSTVTNLLPFCFYPF